MRTNPEGKGDLAPDGDAPLSVGDALSFPAAHSHQVLAPPGGHSFEPPFPPLELVTKPVLTTAEIAYYTNQAEQTWRIHACRETYPEGLKPVRIGGRLNWPTKGAKKLLGVA